MGLYTVLKKHLLPAEPPLLCPNTFLLSKDNTVCVCLFNSHFNQRCCITPGIERDNGRAWVRSDYRAVDGPTPAIR